MNAADMSARLRTGYYGKLPSNGDFVNSNLPATTIEPLDRWLGASLRASQTALGAGWLDAFLVAAPWRGAVPAGVLGPGAHALVMVPSVDRVGRYFPLVLAAPLHDWTGPIDDLPAILAQWYEAAEECALSTLQEGFARAELDAAVDARKGPLAPAEPPTPSQAPADAATLFWTAPGGASLRSEGLPAPERFHLDFLGRSEGGPERAAPASRRMLLEIDLAGSALKGTRSRALTDAAAVGPGDQSATLISGIGTDARLPAAIQQVAARMGKVESPFSMKDLIAEAKGKLGSANAHLHARSAPTGETLVASAATFLQQGGRYAVLWVGNVRLYMLRGGVLHLLTRDHVEPGMRNLITRALGGEVNLTLDVAIGEVRAGDRFLLASPGLFGALRDEEIAETLAGAASARQAVTHLTQDALIAGGVLDAAAIAISFATRA